MPHNSYYSLSVIPLFTDPFRDETQKGLGLPGQPQVYPVLTLELPGGTKRYGSVAVGSETDGLFEPKITQWGTVARAVNPRQANLNAVEVSLELSDVDRSFAKELASNRSSLRGSVATIQCVSPNVEAGPSFVPFFGILDAYTQTRPFHWTLILTPDDRPLLKGDVPKVRITEFDWPNADPDSLGQYAPIIYGTHDSSNINGTGMVRALYVDDSGFRYLLSLGRIQACDRVYVDGVLTPASNYSLTYVTVNGKVFSLIDFSADQVEAVITADVRGLTDLADGTGTLITNPADQLKHFLINFVWGDWRSGEYLSESSAPLHTTYFAETAAYLEALGHEGSKVFSGDTRAKAVDVLNEWLDSHDCRAFWTNSGRLAVRVVDHRTSDIYPAMQWMRGNEEDLDWFGVDYDSQSITPHVSSQWVFGNADGKYFSTLEVQDLSVTQDAQIDRALPWSAAYLT